MFYLFLEDNIEYVMLYLDEERAAKVMESVNIQMISEKDYYKINQLVMKVGFALEHDDPSRGFLTISDEVLRKDLFVVIWGILAKQSLYNIKPISTQQILTSQQMFTSFVNDEDDLKIANEFSSEKSLTGPTEFRVDFISEQLLKKQPDEQLDDQDKISWYKNSSFDESFSEIGKEEEYWVSVLNPLKTTALLAVTE